MKKFTKVLLAGFGLVVLAGAAMVWWPSGEQASPLQSPSVSTPLPPPLAPQTPAAAPVIPPTIKHPIEAIPTQAVPTRLPLPALDAAETHVRRALAEFISDKDVLRYLQLDQFVRHVVATVDNLPREHAAAALWPVAPMPGRFSAGAGDGSDPLGPTRIHANNSTRYTPFVNFIASIDTTKAVSLYVQLYPLFQQAYVELGYPKGYFNDRLVTVIDHLLAAPVHIASLEVSRIQVNGPYQPVRPWVTYEFTKPEMRAMSSGQKMLLRTGAINHQRLRTKLMSIRAQLTQPGLAAQAHADPK
ncbi:MAG: DUF3014 domain-containing protein [Rhodoferax sp.]|uniref:DUF3014 domain-containing protein n=1 Tax=Rhodoferax sp. TaxID=50421 RepID=UPI00262DF67C|nr:DUF3014 domain-containing protein [Rhodoferax sp.]MDD2882608.1 DUF3014 domain-containing protein [Rhodoferax sp.]